MIISGDADSREVYIDGNRITPVYSQSIINHSPDGFNWGYGGSGPSQLALAILLHVTEKPIALRLYQDFKWEFVGAWPVGKDFMVDVDIKSWLDKKIAEKGLVLEEK